VLDEKGNSVSPPQDLQAEILNPKPVYIKPDKTFSLRVPSASPGDWPIIAFYYPNGQGRTEYNLQDMREEQFKIVRGKKRIEIDLSVNPRIAPYSPKENMPQGNQADQSDRYPGNTGSQ
jgi:hypothetical protein